MQSVSDAATTAGAWSQQARERAQQALQPGAPGWPAASARFLLDHGGTLLRLHLALFYVYGTYFQPAKRVTGACLLWELGVAAGPTLQQVPLCQRTTRDHTGAARLLSIRGIVRYTRYVGASGGQQRVRLGEGVA